MHNSCTASNVCHAVAAADQNDAENNASTLRLAMNAGEPKVLVLLAVVMEVWATQGSH